MIELNGTNNLIVQAGIGEKAIGRPKRHRAEPAPASTLGDHQELDLSYVTSLTGV